MAMDQYTIFLIKNTGKRWNITQLCANLSWRDSLNTLGMEFSFDVARNQEDTHLKDLDVVEIGDKVILINHSAEVFRGIITDLDTQRYKKSVTAFDYGFYLNKSRTIIQFRKISVSGAIKQLCSKFSISVGNITNIPTQISKIYKDNTIAEIIKDMLYQATNELGMKYRLEMRKGKLYIERYSDLVVTATFQPASNLPDFNVLDAIGSIGKSESIQDMRNSILVTSNDEKSSRILATAQDQESIGKYGRLQEVESLDDKDISKANNIAKNKLVELNKINEHISIELLGNDIVRSGRILRIHNDIFGLNGEYLVKDCIHTYNNSIHKMSLTVEKVVI